MLALCAGNAAVCAGWQPTPEARMACCVRAAGCPMHGANGHGHDLRQPLSQSQADSCCAAASQRSQSGTAKVSFATSAVITLAPTSLFTAPTTAAVRPAWRALVPLPGSTRPKHLLLSVLLV